MADGDADRIESLLRDIDGGDPAASMRAVQALEETDEASLEDAILRALNDPISSEAGVKAAILFLHYRPALRQSERIFSTVLAALSEPESRDMPAILFLLNLIAEQNRSARPRIVEAFERVLAAKTAQLKEQPGVEELLRHWLSQLAPSAREIQTIGPGRVSEEDIAGLQARFDTWIGSVYASRDDRIQALDNLLARYDTLPTAKAAALSRLLDKMSVLLEILGPREARARRAVPINDLLHIAMYDTREGKQPEQVDEDEDEEAPPEDYDSPEFIDQREYEYAHGYYPRWLKRDLVDDELPWHMAQRTTLERFLEQYSLHDSLLLGAWLAGLTLTLVIQWDTAWVHFEEDRVDFFPEGERKDGLVEHTYGGGDSVAFWPYLLLRMQPVYSLWKTGGPDDLAAIRWEDIYSADSGAVTEDRRRAVDVLSATDAATSAADGEGDAPRLPADAHETTINGSAGTELHIVHSEPVSVLCISRPGTVIRVPDLEDPSA